MCYFKNYPGRSLKSELWGAGIEIGRVQQVVAVVPVERCRGAWTDAVAAKNEGERGWNKAI